MAIFPAALLNAQFEKPVISFLATDHDFGNIKESDGKASTVFEFTNTGRVPLIIQNVRTSCGCTSPEWTREPLVPGQSGKITVAFDPRSRPGPFNKTITITCNAEPAVYTLAIKGNVIPAGTAGIPSMPAYKYMIGDLRLQTVHASFGDIYMGRDDTVSIQIFNASSEKSIQPGFLKIPGHIKVRFLPVVLKPGEKGRIEFTFSSVLKNDWDYCVDRLSLTLNGELLNGNAISLTANVKEDFSSLTGEAFQQSPIAGFDTLTHDFGPVDENILVNHDFLLTNRGKSELFIRKVSASCGCTAVQPSKTVIAPGESTAISVQFDTRGRSGAEKKAITVITNDPRHPKTILWIKADVKGNPGQTGKP
jgi:hypothetical protein